MGCKKLSIFDKTQNVISPLCLRKIQSIGGKYTDLLNIQVSGKKKNWCYISILTENLIKKMYF